MYARSLGSKSNLNEPVTETIFTTNNNDRLLEIYFSHMQLQSQIAQQGGPSHHHAPFLSVNLTGYNHFHQPQQPQQPQRQQSKRRIIEEEKKDGSFLAHSFFIFEESSHQELDTEEDRMAEKLLFFYPDLNDESQNNSRTNLLNGSPMMNGSPTLQLPNKAKPKRKSPRIVPPPFIKRTPVTKDEQLNIVGFIVAYIYFCGHFKPGAKEVDLIRFKKSKMGVRKMGDLYFCLCAPLSTPDGTLRMQCQRVLDMIYFLHGPLHHIKDRAEKREEYEAYVRQMGAELIPLVRGFTDRPCTFFDSVPYTELPPKSNSIFVQSQNILNLLQKQLPGYLGGVVLFDQSVLCTQLPEDVLKFVLYKNQAMNDHNSGQDNSPISAQQEDDPEWVNLNPEAERMKLQMRSQLAIDMMSEEENQQPVANLSQAEKYERARKLIIFGSDDRIALFPAYMLKSKITNLQKEEEDSLDENENIDTDPGDYVSLLLFNYGRATLGMILDLPHALKGTTISQLRELSLEKLKNMEQKTVHHMTAANAPTISLGNDGPRSVSSPSVGNSLSSPVTDLEEIIMSEPNNQQPFILKDGIRLKSNNSVILRSPIDGGSAIEEQRSSNAMLYDSYSKMLTSNNTNDQFLIRAATAHECFERDPTVSKLFLKNATGYLYSKKLFGTQLFYHQITPVPPNAIKAPEYVFLDQLENGVRSCMKKEFQINLM